MEPNRPSDPRQTRRSAVAAPEKKLGPSTRVWRHSFRATEIGSILIACHQAASGRADQLFDQLDRHLNAKGSMARGGQMVDASIVPASKPRNTREENEAVTRPRRLAW